MGAGVAGNYLALRLAGSGHRVAVIEEHQRVGEPMQCTGIVGIECCERFPLFDGLILRTVNSAKLVSPSGVELVLERENPQAHIIDRAAFDRSLAAKAAQQGAEYYLNSTVTDVETHDDGVHVKARGCRSLRAKAAVVATGYSPRLPRRLGLGGASDLIMGAQTSVDLTEESGIEVYFDQSLASGFFAWLVPTSGGRALVGLFSRRSPAKRLLRLVDVLHRQGKITSSGAKPTLAAIPLKTLKKTYTRRVLVVGDAAGQVKPTTGGGIYYGLLCADLAADALERALSNGDVSETRLAAYQDAWHKLLRRELLIDRYARKLYQSLSNRQVDRVFRRVRFNGVHESLLQSPELSFDWHGNVILEALKYLGPWRRLVASGAPDKTPARQPGVTQHG